MNQSSRIRVLVVDDHPVVRGFDRNVGEGSRYRHCGSGAKWAEAIAVFQHQQPDVTLMDLRMPEMVGVQAITVICSEFPNARIIVLTTYDSDEDLSRIASRKGIY